MKLVIGTALAACVPSMAFSTEPGKAFTQELDSIAIEKQLTRSVADGPTDRSLFASEGPQLEVLATEKDKKATLSWAYSNGRVDKKNGISTDTFLLQVSTAFDGSVDSKTLFGLKGFANGTNVSLGYTRFWGKFGDPQTNSVQTDQENTAIKIAVRNCIKRNLGTEIKEMAKICDPENGAFLGSISTFLEHYNPAGFIAAHRSYFPSRTMKFLGGKVTGNQTKFDYFDQVAFSEKKASRFGYEATVFGGLLFTNSPSSVTGSVTFSRDYEAKDPITICQTLTPLQTRCITGPDGLPVESKAIIFSLEGRRAFSFGREGKARLAIAPEISFDAKNDAFSAAVPIYFFPDKEGALKGGIRFGYTNTKNAAGKRDVDFAAGLFFGVPFSIF